MLRYELDPTGLACAKNPARPVHTESPSAHPKIEKGPPACQSDCTAVMCNQLYWHTKWEIRSLKLAWMQVGDLSFDEVTFLLKSLMQRCKERRRDSAHKMANMFFKPKRTPQGCGHSVTDWDFLSAIWERFLPVSINPLYFSVLDGQAPLRVETGSDVKAVTVLLLSSEEVITSGVRMSCLRFLCMRVVQSKDSVVCLGLRVQTPINKKTNFVNCSS